MAKYRLEVEVIEKGWPSPAAIRLRKFLKVALRGYGIKCKGIEKDDGDSGEVRDKEQVDIDNRVP
jgi:hypothetical protein